MTDEERLEQIRQLEEEIAEVDHMMDSGPDEIWTRILARLETSLSELAKLNLTA